MEGDRFAVDKAAKNLEEARTKLRVLREYTKATDVEQLEADINILKAKWKAARSGHELEKSRLVEIQEQLEKCIIRAPVAGQVVFANRASSRSDSEFIVEPGAMVRERQVIIRMPNPGKMQITAMINESRIGLIKVGMPVTVRTVDASDGRPMNGEVVQVNEHPEPQSWHSSYIKEYLCKIKIHNPPPTIRPGYTAMVTIHVQAIDMTIQVPVQSVLVRDKRRFCLVRDSGGWQAREVTVGPLNDKFAVVEEGLAKGSQVALNPRKYEGVAAGLPEVPAGPTRGSGSRRRNGRPGGGGKTGGGR